MVTVRLKGLSNVMMVISVTRIAAHRVVKLPQAVTFADRPSPNVMLQNLVMASTPAVQMTTSSLLVKLVEAEATQPAPSPTVVMAKETAWSITHIVHL